MSDQQSSDCHLQGFCVYYRNRLIKPFWRVYSSNTVGRGVVGYLEADFVSPTADWQDFDRSHAFVKLEVSVPAAASSSCPCREILGSAARATTRNPPGNAARLELPVAVACGSKPASHRASHRAAVLHLLCHRVGLLCPVRRRS